MSISTLNTYSQLSPLFDTYIEEFVKVDISRAILE